VEARGCYYEAMFCGGGLHDVAWLDRSFLFSTGPVRVGSCGFGFWFSVGSVVAIVLVLWLRLPVGSCLSAASVLDDLVGIGGVPRHRRTGVCVLYSATCCSRLIGPVSCSLAGWLCSWGHRLSATFQWLACLLSVRSSACPRSSVLVMPAKRMQRHPPTPAHPARVPGVRAGMHVPSYGARHQTLWEGCSFGSDQSLSRQRTWGAGTTRFPLDLRGIYRRMRLFVVSGGRLFCNV